MPQSSLVSFDVHGSDSSPRSVSRGVAAGNLPPYEAPVTPTEQALAAMWCEILRLDGVGRNDDFFIAGGDSMAAMRLLLRVQETFQLELEPRDVFVNRTIRSLAERIIRQILADVDVQAP